MDPREDVRSEFVDMGPVDPAAFANLPAPTGPTNGITRTTTDGIITAQAVDVHRNIGKVLQTLSIMAQQRATDYYYEWSTKNRDGSKGTVSGPTIKLANDVARIYGNSQVDVRVMDHKDHWIFYARFVDLETGYSLTRAFQQRKNQSIGMKDADRALDITFQIGQSKAIRNVIVNALQTFTDYAVEEAQGSVVKLIEKDVEKYRIKATEALARMRIEPNRVERIIGRTADKWTATDLARIKASLTSISDGMANADEVFPTEAPSAPPPVGAAPPPVNPIPANAPAPSPKPEAAKPTVVAPVSEARVAEIAAIKEADIDTSDVPEQGEDFFQKAKVVTPTKDVQTEEGEEDALNIATLEKLKSNLDAAGDTPDDVLTMWEDIIQTDDYAELPTALKAELKGHYKGLYGKAAGK